MAKNGTGVMEASGGETDAPPVEGKKKRKGLDALRSLKRLFLGRRKEPKEDDGVSKARSTSNVLDASQRDDSAGLSGKSISLSADSVFSQEAPGGARGQNPSAGDSITRSMEVLNKGALNAELNRRLHGNRGHRGDEDDDGLPHSPLTHSTTVDALIENGLRANPERYDSDHSFLSMDSTDTEMEEMEDFFKTSWSVSKLNITPNSDSSAVDLDSVPSTSRVNLKTQRDKLGVKQKGKRQSTAYAQRKRAASPKTHITTSLQVLPQVREEPVVKDISLHDNHQPIREKEEPKKDKRSPKNSSEASDKKDSKLTVVIEKSPKDTKVSKDPKSAEVVEVAKSSAPNSGSTPEPASSPTEEISKPVMVRRSSVDVQVVENAQERPASVVRLRENFNRSVDPEKRQTISGSAEQQQQHSIFGERIVSKRASAFEPKDWEEEKEKVEESVGKGGGEGEGSTEFSQMVNRFKRKASHKKTELQKEADRLDQLAAKPSKDASSESKNPKSGDDKKAAVVVAEKKNGNSSRPQSAEKKTPRNSAEGDKVKSSEESKVAAPSTAAQVVVVEKASSVKGKEESQPASKTATSKELTTDSIKPAPTSAATSSTANTTPAKSFSTSKSVSIKKTEEVNSEKARPKTVTMANPNSSPRLSIGKSQSMKVTNTSGESPKGSPGSYKRDSPLLRDRARSKTLPEQRGSTAEKSTSSEAASKAEQSSNKGTVKAAPAKDIAGVAKPEKPRDKPVLVVPTNKPTNLSTTTPAPKEAKTASTVEKKPEKGSSPPEKGSSPPVNKESTDEKQTKAASSARTAKPAGGNPATSRPKPLTVRSSNTVEGGGGGGGGVSWIALAKKKTKNWNTDQDRDKQEKNEEASQEPENKDKKPPRPKASVLDMVKNMEKFKAS